jgi:hypothetical protein
VTLGVTLPEDYTDDWWRIKYTMDSCAAGSTDRTIWQLVMLNPPPTPGPTPPAGPGAARDCATCP